VQRTQLVEVCVVHLHGDLAARELGFQRPAPAPAFAPAAGSSVPSHLEGVEPYVPVGGGLRSFPFQLNLRSSVHLKTQLNS
jgi:hypothetical protein